MHQFLQTPVVSGVWEAEMTALRIVVKIPAGTYPELCAELSQVNPRERAERMRLLAMIGFMSLGDSGQRVSHAGVLGVPMVAKPAKASDHSAASRLIQKLSSGLQN